MYIEKKKINVDIACIVIFMWMILKFRLLSSLGILHACQFALHKLHDMEGEKKERKEWQNYSGENLIHTYRGILFINHYACTMNTIW